MLKVWVLLVLAFLSLQASADIACKVSRGPETIEVRIYDSFIGRAANIVRTHPLVTYRPVELNVQTRVTSKSIIFLNHAEKFNLKLSKEISMSVDGLTYLKGRFTFEDIVTKIDCYID